MRLTSYLLLQVSSNKVQLVVSQGKPSSTFHYSPAAASSALPSSSSSSPLPLPDPATTAAADTETSGDLRLPSPPPLHPTSSRSNNISSSHNAREIQQQQQHSVAVSLEEKVITNPSTDSLTIISTASSLTGPDTVNASLCTSSSCATLKSDMATQTTQTSPNECDSLLDIRDSVTVSVSTDVNGLRPVVVDSAVVTINSINNNQYQSSTPWSYCNLWPKYGLREGSPPLPVSSEKIESSQANGDITGVSAGLSSQLVDKEAERKELQARLSRKLDILRMQETALNRDLEANESLGSQLLSKLQNSGISSQESEKVNIHCEEIEKVTRLLLSLRKRLKLIDSEMNEKWGSKRCELMDTNSNDHLPEVKLLMSKRCKLLAQLEEALQLRDSIDRRSDLIAERILKKYFCDDSLTNFIEFVKLKSKLIIEIREVKERIACIEKQLDTYNHL
ncbi:hypothetical protein B4U79_12672 [Dinothrombium tinctorium]|uniref:ASD2 domain-containing protein n=1 Tax=Dinothrombium tinctorium TaxID=1965070 RepID=A0A3S3PJN6_9ACAR|nr:hypothetical protein B4U79_12672 [Dinothrombium tinctorium]